MDLKLCIEVNSGPKTRFEWVLSQSDTPEFRYRNPVTVFYEKSKITDTSKFAFGIDKGTQRESKFKILDFLNTWN